MGRAVATLGVAAVFAAGVGVGSVMTGPDGQGATALPDGLELVGSLRSFEGCDDYLDHVRERALEQVGPYGLHGGGGRLYLSEAVDDSEESAAAVPEAGRSASGDLDAGPTPSAGTTPDDVSGTNVQESGVDEPDRVKTDGEVAYTTVGGRLRVLDITGDDPVELAALDLDTGWGAELLLAGDRLLVTSGGGPGVPFAGERFAPDTADGWSAPGGATTTLTAVDVRDPREPVVEERLTLDGATLSARMVDGVARVAIRTEPGVDLPWSQPEAGGLRAEREALAENRALISDSAAEDWLPYFVHEDADGRSTEGLLLDCGQVAQPAEFAGLGTLSVLTVDVGAGRLLPDDGSVGVLAGGDTVYASTGRLYIATQRYVAPEVLEDAMRSGEPDAELDEVSTEVHAFDITDPAGTAYLASGEVPGVLLDQWALSEHDGVLRVASTVGDSWWGGGEDSSSLVTALELDGDRLVEIGRVADLGPTERIYAVRFIGDVGYVVTFRQVDPLYVLDMSDPTDPRVRGELKIAGYSAYLHPLGDGLLLGVGQDADEEDGMTLGTQVSLFDVSDPSDPRRVETLTVEDSHSDVEHDHRAFLHWPATGLTVVPLTRWWWGEEDDDPPAGPPNGALAFTADRNGFAPIAGDDPEELVLTHAADDALGDDPAAARRAWDRHHDAAIQRTIVTGERLLTLSDRGVAVHDLEDLARRGALEY